MLIDDRYGQDALNAATGRGWWIGRPVELPGSNPLEFDRGRSIGTHLVSWPHEHVVKCLVKYHPDAAIENRLDNEAQVRALYDSMVRIVVTPTWVRLNDFQRTAPRAVERLVRAKQG